MPSVYEGDLKPVPSNGPAGLPHQCIAFIPKNSEGAVKKQQSAALVDKGKWIWPDRSSVAFEDRRHARQYQTLRSFDLHRHSHSLRSHVPTVALSRKSRSLMGGGEPGGLLRESRLADSDQRDAAR
jgi:hypothetical protein